METRGTRVRLVDRATRDEERETSGVEYIVIALTATIS